jgi:phospholipid transport system substrate-binding protein
MFTNPGSIDSVVTTRGVGRRALLAVMALTVVPFSRPGLANAGPDATATIKRLNEALLAAMKAGGRTDFNHRFQVLAPAVEQVFDLPAVLAVSVGPSWASLPPDQQNRLLEAFRRYTIASYVANFDSYSGQAFTVSPDTRPLGGGRVVVQSRLTSAGGDQHELDYVMAQSPAGWKVVDVLADGSISRVAVQRSDFRHLLSSGGGNALVTSLQRKTADLSGGAAA